MSKRIRKTLALLLTLTMCLSSLSFSVFAEASEASKVQITNEGGESSSANGEVKVSKTISGTSIENEFEITLEVETTEKVEPSYVDPDASLVLVLDMSGSMKLDKDSKAWCWGDPSTGNCTYKGRYVTYPTTHVCNSATHLWAIDPKVASSKLDVSAANTSRLLQLTKALDTFLSDYATVEEGSGAKRMISVVLFSSDATQYIGWTDISNASNLANVKNKLSYKTLYERGVSGYTYPGKGLDIANSLNNNAAVKDIANRYVVLLTDGYPESTSGASDKTANESGELAVTAALKVKQAAELYTIGFATGNVSLLQGEKTAVNTWLANKVATKPSYHSSAVDNTEITLGLQKINQTIKTLNKAWKVTDPMGDNIQFLGFSDNEPAASENDGTITWNLKDENVSVSGGKYNYDLKYKVRLDNGKSADAAKIYPTNGITSLEYFIKTEVFDANGKLIDGGGTSPTKTQNFPIPEVKGYLGSFSFTKVDKDTNEPLEGVKFQLTHDSDCSVCGYNVSISIPEQVSDKNGVVSFGAIPSGHEYTLTETGVANQGYILEDNQKSYDVAVSYSDTVVLDGTTTVYDSKNATNNMVVTNQGVKIDVAVTKIWNDVDDQDGKRPASITIRLLADGTEVASKAITEADGWKWNFTDLPKYAGGNLISYTITEDEVDGYTTTVDGYNVTNTYKPETIIVEGEKTWEDANDQDRLRPDSITIRLLADGAEIDSRTVTATDNWSWSFTDLPKYAAGTEIVYMITEDAVDGYTSNVNGYNVTNTYSPETTNVSGTKTWDDAENQDGKRPADIMINLFADGEKVDSKVVTAADGWKWSFTDLPKNKAGQPIVYTITEDEVEGYTSEVNGFDVTNTYSPELTSVEGEKTWIDNDDAKGKRPQRITIRLLANGDEVDTKTVTEADDWKWSFINLPKYEDGNEIEYTITEDEVEGYISEVDDYDVINTLIPETISVTVNKVWEDEDDEDGIRPASIEVQLYANGNVYGDAEVLSEDNEWSYTWTDLPKEYEYTVDELEVPAGYRKSIDGFTITNTHEPEEEIPETINITVRKVWDDENDKDGIRPKSIRVQLYAEYEVTDVLERMGQVQNHNDSNATEIREEVRLQIMTGSDALRTLTDSDAIQIPTDSNADDDGLTGGNEEQFKEEAYGKAIRLDESNNWSYTWYDLPAEYSYRVDELEVPEGYEKSIDGYVITNTHEPEEIIPETTSVTVTKTWNDNNDKAKLRPDSIEVQLYADGEKSGDSITLSEENDWIYTWIDLPVDITYTVDETEVPNRYEKTIKSRGNDFEIINKLVDKRTEPDDDEDDDDRDRATTAPTTTVPETTAPETTVPETTVPETVIYRGVEIPREILDAYPDKTLDELYDMGVLGAYFENVPVGLLPATTDVTWVWAVLLLISGLGVAGVSMLGKKRENE